jgi:ribosome-associated heat shock protein Hsp15
LNDASAPAPNERRLDQWLWFARFSKTRSVAARLCLSGRIVVNGVMVKKANHVLRLGDTVVVPHGQLRRSVRVLGLGSRRGPYAEACLLYEETAAPVRLADPAAPWTPLLADDERAW